MAALDDASQLLEGTISKMFLTKIFEYLSSIHMYVNNTDIINFGRKVRTIGKVDSNGDLVKVNGHWIPMDNRKCIPDKIKRATVKRLTRDSGQFLKLMDNAKSALFQRGGISDNIMTERPTLAKNSLVTTQLASVLTPLDIRELLNASDASQNAPDVRMHKITHQMHQHCLRIAWLPHNRTVCPLLSKLGNYVMYHGK